MVAKFRLVVPTINGGEMSRNLIVWLVVLVAFAAFLLLIMSVAYADQCEHGVIKAGQVRCYPGWYRSA